MNKKIPLSRPAMSAIAAFLALSAPAAFAQETPTVPMTPPVASPPVSSPPTVAQPSMTAPVAAAQTAPPPAPKPVIRVPLDLPPVPAKPAPKVAERAAAPAPARAERSAPRARTAPAAVAAGSAPRVADTASPAAEAVPVAAPVMAPAEPVAKAVPLPVEQTAPAGNSFPWELAGGAAALLLVGGAGLALARRRRAQRVIEDDAVSYEAAPATTELLTGEPLAAEPLTAEQKPWVTPAYNPPVAQRPAMRTAPAFADAAPNGGMGRHEALALTGPTPDNPFATLKKRLARARFLDSQERAQYDETLAAQKDMSRKPVSAWEIAQRPVTAPAEQGVRRPEPVRGQAGRTGSLRPGYSRH